LTPPSPSPSPSHHTKNTFVAFFLLLLLSNIIQKRRIISMKMLVKGENGYGILFDKKCCLIGGLE
jgi:hypothetical protein